MVPGPRSLAELLNQILGDRRRRDSISGGEFERFERPINGAWAQSATGKAHDRGMLLLKENLSPAQRAQYAACSYFDVVGGKTGRRYRITTGTEMNVYRIDKRGRLLHVLCFMPKGNLVVGDVMLAQKLALELFEAETLKVANTLPRVSPLINSDP